MEEALNQKLSKIKYKIFYKIAGVFLYSAGLIIIATRFISDYQNTQGKLETKKQALNELTYKNQVLNNNQKELEDLDENFRHQLMGKDNYGKFKSKLEKKLKVVIDRINQNYTLPKPISLDLAVPVINKNIYKNAPSEVKSLKIKLSYATSDADSFIDIANTIYSEVNEDLEITGFYMDKAEVLDAGNINNIIEGKDPILVEGQLTFFNRELIIDKN